MLWVKAIHVIFMVTWFAGLFYLPRLFVYHATTTDEISLQRFVIMERKLFAIMTIGGLGALIFGLWMMFDYAIELYQGQGWLHAKMFFVLLLIAYHVLCFKVLKEFREGKNKRGHVFYRWFNEFPALILFVVVILVIVKPF
ncbi:MAG: protoporphyrinogen oxidase HemJ [Gammaproteobacteria bacterium]|nr:protoporphyrinogen oxidase HemJ [Gammaproteobacteria bacterium]MDH5691895.1 protoporphyrinogen oxidase HemJ [Gammaproteobacteria bacterium]